MPRIALTRSLPGDAEAMLAAVGEPALPERAADASGPLEPGELLRHVAGADALVCLLHDRVDEALLDAVGPQLRIVANVAVGYDNIDVEAARQRGVAVSNTPGVLTDATADLALALMLAVTRRVGEGERLIRSGEPWRFDLDFMLGAGLAGKRLGIVGLGEIGAAVARRARAFGLTIAYGGRRRAPAEREAELEATHLELDELLATSAIVSLHCPLTAETHHLLDARRLALLRRDAYLINTARGPIVDERALADALRERRIAGAALDVYEHEPQVEPALRELDNAVLLPHLGSATHETRAAMAELAARNVVAALMGDPLPSPVA